MSRTVDLNDLCKLSVLAFADAIAENRRRAYFVLDSIRSESGALIPCMAIEGVAGFYQTDWEWDTSLTQAKMYAQDMNNRLGVTEEDAENIIFSTMKPAVFN